MFIDIEHLIFLNNVKVESFVGKVQKNTLCKQTHQKWGDNVLKACPSIQWPLVNRKKYNYCKIVNLYFASFELIQV